jgi:hypothetical protein
LDEARKKGEIGPSDIHQLSVLVSFKEEIATDAQLEQSEAIIAAAADLGIPEVAIDGAQLPTPADGGALKGCSMSQRSGIEPVAKVRDRARCAL